MTKTEEMKRLEADMASDKELYEKFYKIVDRSRYGFGQGTLREVLQDR